MPKKTVRKAKAAPKKGDCKTITRKDGTKQKMCWIGRCKPGTEYGVRKDGKPKKRSCSPTGYAFTSLSTRRARSK